MAAAWWQYIVYKLRMMKIIGENERISRGEISAGIGGGKAGASRSRSTNACGGVSAKMSKRSANESGESLSKGRNQWLWLGGYVAWRKYEEENKQCRNDVEAENDGEA
jgi:hypothetical protein